MDLSRFVNMDKNISKNLTLPQYLEQLLLQGKHYFTTEDLQKNLGMNKNTLSVSLSRLSKKGRVKMIRRGFGIILEIGGFEPHPSYYIEAMMNHLGVQYYVGLLTAAAHWGAGHQASMSYQVVVDRPVFKISFKKFRMEFVTKKETFPEKGIQRVAGVGGYFKISSPELTAIDLVRFPKKSGHLNNIATVLKDLASKWDGRSMFSLCLDSLVPSVTLQRLGYLLDHVLGFEKEAGYLRRALRERRFVSALLSQANNKNDSKMSDYNFDELWRLYINSKVEPD